MISELMKRCAQYPLLAVDDLSINAKIVKLSAVIAKHAQVIHRESWSPFTAWIEPHRKQAAGVSGYPHYPQPL